MAKIKKVAAVAAVLIFGLGFMSGSSYEQTKNTASQMTVEKYVVKSGDTFWTIAQKYFDRDSRNLYILEYHDELRALNPELEERHCQLQPGDVITVSYYEE